MFDAVARGPLGAVAFSSGSYVVMCSLMLSGYFEWTYEGIGKVLIAFVVWLLLFVAFLVWHWRIWYAVAPQVPFLLVALRRIGRVFFCAADGFSSCIH